MRFIIGVNASNLSSGGGLTHLIELINYIEKLKISDIKIIIWSSRSTLSKLPQYTFLLKKTHKLLNGGSLQSLIWQTLFLTDSCMKAKADVLFSPGGSYSGGYSPSVVMCQNMLPFELQHSKKYRISLTFFRMLLLRFLQTRAFSKADGLIFLSEYAEKIVKQKVKVSKNSIIVRHGVAKRFQKKPNNQNKLYANNIVENYRLLYVSKLDVYKNHKNLISAISNIRSKYGWDIKLDLVGPSYDPVLKKYKRLKRNLDKDNTWLFYHGNVQYQRLHEYYHRANLGVFLSSCENLPIILIEKMAAGLPIVSSNKGPMPEVLRNFAFYCNPEDTKSIECAIIEAIKYPDKRKKFAQGAYELSLSYSWEDCVVNTIDFLRSCCEKADYKLLD